MKKYFITGLLIWIPLVITIWVLKLVVDVLDQSLLLLPVGWPMLVFVASTLPITIFANAARVVLTGLIGQQFGVDYATGFFHEFAGLVIYAFAFLCLAGVYSLLLLVGRARTPVPSP